MPYKPKTSDVYWLKGMFDLMKVGATWVAPMGFTFVKTDEIRSP